jgi:hypothetical protein
MAHPAYSGSFYFTRVYPEVCVFRDISRLCEIRGGGWQICLKLRINAPSATLGYLRVFTRKYLEEPTKAMDSGR